MAQKKKTKARVRAKFVKDTLATKDRVVRAPGGGEPIPKGEKWQDEERELDAPRAEDGKFAPKSSVGEETKYPKHPERGTYKKGHPLNPVGKDLSGTEKKRIWREQVRTDTDFGREAVHQLQKQAIYAKKKDPDVKAGSKFAINGHIYIASINMTMDEFRDAIYNYWKGGDGEGHFGTLDSGLVVKTGARSKAEKAALERSVSKDLTKVDKVQLVTDEKGKAEIAKLDGKSTKKKMREAAKATKDLREKGYPTHNPSAFVKKGGLDKNSAKYQQNKAHNQAHSFQQQVNPQPAPAQPAVAPAVQGQATAQKIASVKSIPMSSSSFSSTIKDALNGIKLDKGGEAVGASDSVISGASESIKNALSKFIKK